MTAARNLKFLRIGPLVLIVMLLCSFTYSKVIHVDNDAAGANNGTSWFDAYNYLQDALADANSAEKPVEIRVAKGTYRPNQGFVAIPEYAIPEFNWRTTTFQLIDGVTLKGGYAGFSESDTNTRNIDVYESILSGDLNGDDVEVADPCDLSDEPTRADNSYHVVTGSGTNATAVLDGFTICGGNANGSSPNLPDNKGGGMYNRYSSPTVINCTFSGNSAGIGISGFGGGMCNDYSETTVTNCIFSGNWARGAGGGMYNMHGSPTFAVRHLNRHF